MNRKTSSGSSTTNDIKKSKTSGGRRTIFKKVCSHPSCSNLTNSRFCELHSNSGDRHRGTSTERGYDSRWRKYRKAYLNRHPFCVQCEKEGRITLANVVDHIVPHKGNEDLFWDSKNHQALCESCHNRKTRTQDMGAWHSKGG